MKQSHKISETYRKACHMAGLSSLLGKEAYLLVELEYIWEFWESEDQIS